MIILIVWIFFYEVIENCFLKMDIVELYEVEKGYVRIIFIFV